MRRLFLLALFVGAFQFPGVAQLQFDGKQSAENLVRSVLLSDESDMIVKNIRYTGSENSIAAFSIKDSLLFMQRGLMLSTGYISDAKGPNNDKRTGRKVSGIKDLDLQAIATGVVTDAAVLEFDLISLRDSLVFEYVFASEEYPEYVSTGVNDVFAFFITEVGGKALFPRNIATLPNSRRAVSIDNVNHRVNEEYFLPSDFFEIHSQEYWKAHPDIFRRAATFEFDGFTTPLKAILKLKAGKTYHLKIAIGDVGDGIVDSAVLLRAKSLSAKGKLVEGVDSIVKAQVYHKMKAYRSSFNLSDDLSFTLQINFNTNEAIIQEKSFAELNDLAELLLEFPSLELEIIGHTDDVGNNEDNLQLSIRRAIAIKKYLVNKKIATERLKTNGVGELKPIADNTSELGRAKNRRVEFGISF